MSPPTRQHTRQVPAHSAPSQQEAVALITLFNQSRFAEVKNMARSLTDRFPHDRLGWFLGGIALVQMGQYSDALPSMQKAVELAPSEADAHNILGVVLFNLGRLEDAEFSYRRAIQVMPNYAEAHNNLGNALKAMNRFVEAESCYQQAIQIKSDYAVAHFNLGVALKEMSRIGEAEASYRRAVQIKPDYAEAHTNLGLVLQDMGLFDAAEICYRRALQIKPDSAETHTNLGSLLFYLGRLDEAEHSCQQALRLKPNFAEAHSILGSTLHNQGRLEEAEASCRQAIQIKPDFAEAYGNLGRTLRKRECLAEALDCFHQQIRLDPENIDAQYHVASLSGQNTERAPTQYVEKLFDSYADNFDAHLLQTLKYESPEKLVKLIIRHVSPPAEKWKVLDLGCGTGLVAPVIAPFAKELVGVDLSSKMLERAGERNLYQRLEHSDLLSMMRNEEAASYDVIIAADVFVYLGLLDEIVGEIKRLLRPDGIAAFSVEALEMPRCHGQEYQLEKTGRYTHSVDYISKLAASNDFHHQEIVSTQIRMEHGNPVNGHLVLWNIKPNK